MTKNKFTNKTNLELPVWLESAPYAPTFRVLDTLYKYGRYALQTKVITVADLVKFHGHLCGGLMETTVALKAAFDLLFPDGIIDRTDLAIVSNNSTCGGDVAAYLTGARTRFGSHIIDTTLDGGEFIVHKVSSGETVHVQIKPEMYPSEVKAQMHKLLSGEYMPQDIDRFGEVQWSYAKRLVQKPASESFSIQFLNDFELPEPTCDDLGKRSDNDYKNAP